VKPERVSSAMPPSGNHSLGAAIAFVLIVGACSGIYVLWQRVRETARPASENTTAAREASPQPRPQAETPAPVAAPAPPPVQPSNEQAPPAEAAPAAEDIRIQVRASREEWIKVTADGGNVFAGILQPNESKTFDGKERVSIRFGNPGAVDVTWNGKPVADIGPAGQPRTVQFTREAYHVLSPAPPKPQPESDEP
jgi:hypothetical protein